MASVALVPGSSSLSDAEILAQLNNPLPFTEGETIFCVPTSFVQDVKCSLQNASDSTTLREGEPAGPGPIDASSLADPVYYPLLREGIVSMRQILFVGLHVFASKVFFFSVA